MWLIFTDAYLQVNLTFLITDKVYLSGKIKVSAGASKCLTLFPLDICTHREVSSLYDVGDDDGEKDNDNKC